MHISATADKPEFQTLECVHDAWWLGCKFALLLDARVCGDRRRGGVCPRSVRRLGAHDLRAGAACVGAGTFTRSAPREQSAASLYQPPSQTCGRGDREAAL